jgi:hypothetical protein
MESDLVTASALEDLLSDVCVIDLSLFKSGDEYHGKAVTILGTVEAAGSSKEEMILSLKQKVDDLFNADRN